MLSAHAEQHMTDTDLLERYQQTRQALFDTAPAAWRAAWDTHHETLRMVEARFPGIQHSHSTAEWHLRQAIETTC